MRPFPSKRSTEILETSLANSEAGDSAFVICRTVNVSLLATTSFSNGLAFICFEGK